MATLDWMRNDKLPSLEKTREFIKRRIRNVDAAFNHFQIPEEYQASYMADSWGARECRAAFEAAREKRDLIEASKHFELKPDVTPSLSWEGGRVAYLVKFNTRIEGLQQVIGWLEKLEHMVVERTKPSVFIHVFVQMGLDELGNCDCDPPFFSSAMPPLAWVHENHAVLNRALWELANAFGRQRLREALKRDLGKKPTFFRRMDGTEEDRAFGDILEKDFARKLLDEFFVANPSRNWIRPQRNEQPTPVTAG